MLNLTQFDEMVIMTGREIMDSWKKYLQHYKLKYKKNDNKWWKLLNLFWVLFKRKKYTTPVFVALILDHYIVQYGEFCSYCLTIIQFIWFKASELGKISRVYIYILAYDVEPLKSKTLRMSPLKYTSYKL